MCLFKDARAHPHDRPLVAKEDITCYKQVYESIDGEYITPYTNTVIPIECIKNKVPFKAKIDKIFKFFWYHVLGKSAIVNDGFIHVHVYPPQQSCVTFECIIPKGTKYFIGYRNDLAAKEIIFLKKL